MYWIMGVKSRITKNTLKVEIRENFLAVTVSDLAIQPYQSNWHEFGANVEKCQYYWSYGTSQIGNIEYN